ncbi:hypothetical protein [Desulfosarcina cetonica]|uniref:hypothetical protein n=1 Tax=Desulfosarcina cetonica TaxID=90730 RepID=UPI0012ED9303|nr:hypothetical protein [Desulfosarcina cetonica]
MVEKNVAARKETLDLVYRDNLAQAFTVYWDLVYTHQAQRITREMRDRLNHLESVATTRYGAGKTSYQDVVKIRMRRERLVDQLATLSGMRTNQETALLSLFDLAPGSVVASPSIHTPRLDLPKLEPLYALALEKRQELRRLRARVGRMERMIEMGETMDQPPFTQNAALFTDEAILQVGSSAMKPSFGTTVAPARGKGVPANAWFGSRKAYLRETRRNLEACAGSLPMPRRARA